MSNHNAEVKTAHVIVGHINSSTGFPSLKSKNSPLSILDHLYSFIHSFHSFIQHILDQTPSSQQLPGLARGAEKKTRDLVHSRECWGRGKVPRVRGRRSWGQEEGTRQPGKERVYRMSKQHEGAGCIVGTEENHHGRSRALNGEVSRNERGALRHRGVHPDSLPRICSPQAS